MSDCLDTVEAAYRLDLGDREWLQRIADTAAPWMDGDALTAWTYEAPETGGLTVFDIVTAASSPPEIARQQIRSLQDNAALASTLLLRTGPCATASEAMGELHEGVRGANPPGVEDGLGVIGASPEGQGVVLSAALSCMRALRRRERARLSRVAAHLGTAFRLRRALRGEEREVPEARIAEAVLDPGGKCVHAEGPATIPSARERLRSMARDVDRARTRRNREHVDGSLELWRGLVSARWSLVDHFDADGRRYVVAMRNPPAGRAIRALSERENQVAALAAMGHPHKLIAYALGLAPSTVAGHLRRAIRKLGLRDRTELVAALSRVAPRNSGS